MINYIKLILASISVGKHVSLCPAHWALCCQNLWYVSHAYVVHFMLYMHIYISISVIDRI